MYLVNNPIFNGSMLTTTRTSGACSNMQCFTSV